MVDLRGKLYSNNSRRCHFQHHMNALFLKKRNLSCVFSSPPGLRAMSAEHFWNCSLYIVWQLHSFIQTHNELRHGFCRVRDWSGIDCLKDFVESGKPGAISVNLVNLVIPENAVIPQKYSKVVFTADWFRITLCNWSWLTFVTGMTLVRIWKLVSISTI